MSWSKQTSSQRQVWSIATFIGAQEGMSKRMAAVEIICPMKQTSEKRSSVTGHEDHQKEPVRVSFQHLQVQRWQMLNPHAKASQARTFLLPSSLLISRTTTPKESGVWLAGWERREWNVGSWPCMPSLRDLSLHISIILSWEKAGSFNLKFSKKLQDWIFQLLNLYCVLKWSEDCWYYSVWPESHGICPKVYMVQGKSLLPWTNEKV